jgi:5'-nucleotidase (lipoprotein e(P4) family)
MVGAMRPSQLLKRGPFKSVRRWIAASMLLNSSALAMCGCVSQSYPDALHWYRDSAEQKAVYLETYREAGKSVEKLSRDLPQHSWAVILDIDETVLDNSEYQKRLALSQKQYDSKSWSAWVNEGAATALPGAKAFTDNVLDYLRGQVVLVTNRTQAQCAITESNLHAVQIRYSRILCDSVGDGNKNARFKIVMEGEPGITTPLKVLAWVGDNIQDFPGLSQTAPGDPELYGTKYFVLPNPMYGSWTSNVLR